MDSSFWINPSRPGGEPNYLAVPLSKIGPDREDLVKGADYTYGWPALTWRDRNDPSQEFPDYIEIS